MLARNRKAALQREAAASSQIPYSAHVAPGIVKTRSGDYLQAFRLGGISFECADEAQLNTWHERLNVLWRNIASPHVALWTHVIRRPHRMTGSGAKAAAPKFAASLASKYERRLAEETLMTNEIFLATVYRPSAGIAQGLASKVLSRTRIESVQEEQASVLDACGKLSQALLASLERYEPHALGAYRVGRHWCSSLLEYLAELVNGECQRMPLLPSPVNETLATSRLMFGSEALEYRTPVRTRIGAMLGIKEYPAPSVVGMFNRLLAAPFAFVLTQSFAFLSKSASQSLLQRQYYRMANAGDFAVSQAEELKQALDSLTSNEFVMGDHHFSLQIVADVDAWKANEAGADRLKRLNEHIALARSLLADTGMSVAREDLALEAAFWAQLPGNFSLRPRKAPITSRNFAAMSAFHNFPAGRPSGNYWGEAHTVFASSAKSPYYFSLHPSLGAADSAASLKDAGHTLICGPTGSGKTVLIGFLMAMLHRQGVTQIILDKDCGLEILVRALEGEYLPLRNGIATGFNPLQLPATPSNIEFLKVWLRELSRAGARGGTMSVREQADLDQALRGTLALNPSARRLSRLVEFLDPTDPEGVHARLARWCHATNGDYAWVFDNACDSVVSRLNGRPVIGFDVTDFLDNGSTRSPVTLYLFHLVRQLLDGRKLVCWMDEFWRLLADSAFESFAKEGPKTWRKLNGVICLATQSASDVLESPISRTLVEQTQTKIFFPNPEADFAEYTQGFGLSVREFKLLKEHMEPGSRCFLVKQGHHSVVCELDLNGFDAELTVISGRASHLRRMRRLIADLGPDPEQWLPSFMQMSN